MKAYVCDSCGKTITDPYMAKMKQYTACINCDGNLNHVKRNVKVHLCADCFKSLGEIARKVESR